MDLTKLTLEPRPPRRASEEEQGLRVGAVHVVLVGSGLLLLLLLAAVTVAPRKPSERPLYRGLAGRVLQAAPLQGVAPEGVALLKRMEAAAREVQTLQVDGVYSIGAETGALSHRRGGSFHLVFQAPNRLSQYVETTGKIQTDRIVADGHALILEVRAANLALRMPQPESAIGFAEIMSASLPGTQNPLDLFRLRATGLDLQALELVALGVDRHDPWIRALQPPENSVALTVRFAGWPQATVWMDQQTYLIRQIAQEISGEEAQAMANRLGGVAPVLFRSMAPPTRVRVVMRQFVTGLNVPLRGAPFDYSPPAGVQIVDVSTWEEARRVMMERLGDALAAEAAQSDEIRVEPPPQAQPSAPTP